MQIELTDVARGSGRFGLAARGSMYCVGALLTARLAAGGSEEISREGALEAVARQPLGGVLLVILAVGFAAYALWRGTKAVTGSAEGGDGDSAATSVARRVADAGRTLLYVSAVVTCVRLVVGGRGSAGGEERERELSVKLMEQGWGRALVLAIGLAVMAWGIGLAAKALKDSMREKLYVSRMRPWEKTWWPVLGKVGYTARGAVVALVGWFLARAAWRFDPQEAVGVDGALHKLAGQGWGTALLAAVAAGLLAFGAYSFVEARYRKVLDD